MEDEVLIESVRQHGCLYDMADPKYLDGQYKTRIWKAIAEQMHQSDENCKKRWGNIRDQFKKSINKRKTKSGQSAKTIKKYKYEENLQFLLPFIQDRETISNIESSNEETEQISDISTPTDESMDRLTPSSTPLPQPTDEISTSSRLLPHTRKRRFSRTMPSAPPNESASNTLLKYIIEKNATSETDKHPIDAFFQGLTPTIKGFSPYYQHIAKGKICSIVQELEYIQMQPSVLTLQDIPQAYDSSSSS